MPGYQQDARHYIRPFKNLSNPKTTLPIGIYYYHLMGGGQDLGLRVEKH